VTRSYIITKCPCQDAVGEYVQRLPYLFEHSSNDYFINRKRVNLWALSSHDGKMIAQITINSEVPPFNGWLERKDVFGKLAPCDMEVRSATESLREPLPPPQTTTAVPSPSITPQPVPSAAASTVQGTYVFLLVNTQEAADSPSSLVT
jgi:hypothetical protein